MRILIAMLLSVITLSVTAEIITHEECITDLDKCVAKANTMKAVHDKEVTELKAENKLLKSKEEELYDKESDLIRRESQIQAISDRLNDITVLDRTSELQNSLRESEGKIQLLQNKIKKIKEAESITQDLGSAFKVLERINNIGSLSEDGNKGSIRRDIEIFNRLLKLEDKRLNIEKSIGVELDEEVKKVVVKLQERKIIPRIYYITLKYPTDKTILPGEEIEIEVKIYRDKPSTNLEIKEVPFLDLSDEKPYIVFEKEKSIEIIPSISESTSGHYMWKIKSDEEGDYSFMVGAGYYGSVFSGKIIKIKASSAFESLLNTISIYISKAYNNIAQWVAIIALLITNLGIIFGFLGIKKENSNKVNSADVTPRRFYRRSPPPRG